MPRLKNELKRALLGAERIAILGIGSDLRADDAAGMLVAGDLDRSFKKIRDPERVRVFFGKTAPENLTGEIKRFGPTHLIIVDAIDAKRKPGSILRFSSSDIGGASFLTHRISARALIDYLTGSIKCEVSIIGIQPKSLEFGKPPCEAVRKSAKKISDAIRLAAADS